MDESQLAIIKMNHRWQYDKLESQVW